MLKKNDRNFSFLDSSRKYLANIENRLRALDSYLEGSGCDDDLALSELSKLSRDEDLLCRQIRNDFYLKVSDDSNLLLDPRTDNSNPISADAERVDDIITFSISDLPPKRIEKTAGNRYDTVSLPYYKEAIEKAIEDNRIYYHYSEKCVIVYYLFFNKERNTTDIDNFDLKPITDLLKVHFLTDDSFPYMSQVINGSFTEGNPRMTITLMPWEKYNKSNV